MACSHDEHGHMMTHTVGPIYLLESTPINTIYLIPYAPHMIDRPPGCKVVSKAFKVQLRPNRRQEGMLWKHLSAAWEEHNTYLAFLDGYYEKHGKTAPYEDKKRYRKQRKAGSRKLRAADAMTTVAEHRNVDAAFDNFFRRVKKGEVPGYPRFQRWRDFKSFKVHYQSSPIRHDSIKLGKIGWMRLEEKGYLPVSTGPKNQDVTTSDGLPGWVNSVTVTYDGKWNVSIQVDCCIPDVMTDDISIVGIDMGMSTIKRNWMVLSDGTRMAPPASFVKNEERLARLMKRRSKMGWVHVGDLDGRDMPSEMTPELRLVLHDGAHSMTDRTKSNLGTFRSLKFVEGEAGRIMWLKKVRGKGMFDVAKLVRLRNCIRVYVSQNTRAEKKMDDKIQKLHRRVRLQRRDAQHKATSAVVGRYTDIVVEDLDIEQLKCGHRLQNKAVSDAAVGELKRQLVYKADWANKRVWEVDRYFPSSEMCSRCGHIVDGFPVHRKIFRCPVCGHTADRDINASHNLRNVGMIVTGGRPGLEMPLETRSSDSFVVSYFGHHVTVNLLSVNEEGGPQQT